jgi:hypothetical protein
VANIFLTYFFLALFLKQSQQQQQQFKCSTTMLITTRKINNVMPEIQVIKNIVIFPT